MSRTTHIINRQVFEFECRESEHAFQMQRKMDHVVQERISRVINKVCDELTTENEDIQLPVLEIDLGAIRFENLEDEIAAYFEKHFYEKLSEKLAGQRDKSITRIDKSGSSIQTIAYFFLTGQLPWYAGKQNQSYIAELLDEILSLDDESFKKLILLNLGNRQFLERFIATTELHQVETVLAKLGIPSAILHELEEEVLVTVTSLLAAVKKAIPKIYTSKSVQPLSSWQVLQIEKIDKEISNWLEDIVWNRIGTLRPLAYEILIKMISEEAPIVNEQFVEQLQKAAADKFYLDWKLIEEEIEQQAIVYPQLPETINTEQQKIKKEKEEYTSELKEEVTADTKTKFYISNSGLIILAQYLPAFFNVLGLLEDGAFISKQNKIKAVFLLHYICTGEEKVPEYILPLNKLLCGLSLEEPLPSFVALTEQEKIECMELLEEIIHNWNRLGTSSAESIRDAFLNREGILWYDEVHGWKLQVDRRGYDILLDSLPWSFRQIKLSWMEHIINTEW